MLQNRKILVVDHSESDRLLIAGYLGQLGFDCICFENVYKLISAIDQFEKSIILLDAELPGIVGVEAAKALRNRLERTGRNNIYIALTTYGDDFAGIAFRSGFDGFLTKPVDPGELQACLDRYLNEPEAVEVDRKPVALSPAAEKLYSLDMFNGDEPEFIRSIVEIFVSNTPLTIEAIRIAFAKADMKEVKFLAHKIKPHFGFFGASELQKSMQMIEDIGTGIGDGNKFFELLDRADKESSLLIAQLKKDMLS